MDSKLRTVDRDLRDLARGEPALLDVVGRPTGLRLRKWLGAGGMATVFQAELESHEPAAALSPLTPSRLAVKILKPSTIQQAEPFGVDAFAFFVRDFEALSRVMSRHPPTEFVVDFFGSGGTPIDVKGELYHLPWVAIELVSGGPDGVTLTDRVTCASREGVDPLRAYRLLNGIFEGVTTLHEEEILHRDLKPDNVLVAGPIDDETPKITDCGIARIEGVYGTVAAMTPEYAGPEQALSTPGGESNPLIGQWTDVHALSAIAWFILAGDTWCPDPQHPEWRRGVRRSLLTAPHLHRAFSLDPTLCGRIDAVLAKGAAHRLPDAAWRKVGAASYEERGRVRFPSMFSGEPRFASVAELRAALFPLLEQCMADWQSWCSIHDQTPTAFRSTRKLQTPVPDEPLCTIRLIERFPRPSNRPPPTVPGAHAAPGDVVFQPDGKVLVRFGEEITYFSGDHSRAVWLPAQHRALVEDSRWLSRGPGGGFALVGPNHILLIKGDRCQQMPFPSRPDGGAVGPIQAVVRGGTMFGVVTEETEESNGGSELWLSLDGTAWDAPIVAPLGGDPVAVSSGPSGFLVVGSRRGTRARALFLPLDKHAIVYTAGVNERSPLRVALSGTGRDGWAAGDGYVLHFQRGSVDEEEADSATSPTAMGLDPVGVPWLVTTHAVLRRHVEQGKARWRTYHMREPKAPPWIAIGFSGDGAQVIDSRGGATLIIPRDITFWSRV